MKVTFIIPPVLDGTHDVDRCFGCNYSIYFLPLLPVIYTATILKAEAEHITMVDFPSLKKSIGDFKEFIRRDDSDVYCFYTVFLCQNTDKLARDFIRTVKPQAHFIFIGPQPTFSPEVFLDKEDTFAVRGEPEFIVPKVVRLLRNGQDPAAIKGISFVRSGKIIHNNPAELIADIDSLPIPDRSMLDHKYYYNPKLRRLPHTAALTSRGCFGQCWFCVPNSLSYARELEYKKHFGKKPPPRVHSAKRVIEEFSNIAALGFKSVSIIDDQFLWDEGRTLEICAGIKDLNLEWSCLCRPDRISETVARAMKEAGCSYVDLGTESFDAGILAAIKKDMVPGDTERAVKILKKNKIGVEINVLFGGTPKETNETIRKTIRAVKKLDVDYALFSIANPFPGTEFYDAAKKEGWLYFGKYVPVDPAKNAIISYPHLSKQKLERYICYAYLSYYFSPRYLLRQIIKIKGPRDFFHKIATAVTFFRKNFLIKTKSKRYVHERNT